MGARQGREEAGKGKKLPRQKAQPLQRPGVRASGAWFLVKGWGGGEPGFAKEP